MSSEPRPDAGFTLLEIIVSLGLLALILAMVPGTLHLGKRAWEATGELDEAAGVGAAVALIERQLASAMPVYERAEDGRLGLAFTGTSRSVRFAAPFPAGPAGGGIQSVVLDGSRSDGTLGYTIAPFRAAGPSASPPGAPVARRVLINYVRAVSFRYYGAPARGEPAAWLTSWARKDRLPDLVEFSLSIGGPGGRAIRPAVVELKMKTPY